MKLFLLDAYALIYRAHFAFIKKPLINSKGLNTSAVHGFMNTLWELLQKEKPTHIGVAFDLSGPTFRTELYPEYKANREEQPQDITIAVPYIKKILKGFNIPILELAGYEADDVIGALSKQAAKEGFTVYMMTPDKDYAQLVEENIFMYKPAHLGNEFEILGVKEVCEKWGIERVEQVIDCLGLQGDAVDNIPGVPSIGPKSAQALLAKFGSVEGILANIDQLAGKQKEAFEKFGEQGLLSKTLARIDIDAPIKFDAEACKMGEWNKDALGELFKELEMRSLSNKVLGVSAAKPANNEPPKAGTQGSLFGDEYPAQAPKEEPVRKISIADKNIENTPHTYHLVETSEQQTELVKELLKYDSVCFDTETTGLDATEAELVGMSFAVKPHEAWYVPVPANQDEARKMLETFRPFFENEKIEKIGQNIKYDALILHFYGIEVRGNYFDTLIAHFLIEPDHRHNMNYLSETYLNYSPVSIETLIGKGKGQLSMRDISIQRVADYAAEDADVTLQLKAKLEPLLADGVKSLYYKIEEPIIRVLTLMEAEGVRINSDFLNDYSVVLEKDMKELQEKIFEMGGVREINLNAPGQIGQLLFDKMKIPYRWKKTKTGAYSTDEEILSELALEHEIVKDILDFRSLAKLKSTYVDALPRMVNPRTGRIHSSFNQALAQTGRLSSQNPNLQNIPVRTERGREVRKAFIPRDENHVLISADYSQIELRIIAELSHERNMIDAFQKGIDIHTATAAKVFNVAIEDVTKEQRYRAKTVNFSILYGAGAINLSRQLGIKRAEAAQIIESYFSGFPELKAYMEKILADARETGYVTTLGGRRRYLRDINSNSSLSRSNEERVAINTPIQGSAADMIKIAMISVQKELKEKNLQTKLILQVHDELIFDVPKAEIELVKPIIERCMKTALPNLTVPIEVGMGVGDNWLEAH